MCYEQSIVCRPDLFRFLFPFIGYNAICPSFYIIWQYETSAFKTVVTQLITESIVILDSLKCRSIWNTTIFCGVFNISISVSNCRVLNGRMVDKWSIGCNSEQSGCGLVEILSCYLLEGAEKTQPRFQWTFQQFKSQTLTISTTISVIPLSNSATWILSRSSEFQEWELEICKEKL
jgi:hypothetical protein